MGTIRIIFSMLCLLCITQTFAMPTGGSYCINQGYIAYEFELADTATQPSNHKLFVRFLEQSVHSKTVALPQFEVLGMRCSSQQVVLQSSDTMYVVQWDKKQNPKLVENFPVPLADSLTHLPHNLGERLWANTPYSTTIQLTENRQGQYWALKLSHKRHSSTNGENKVIHHQNLSELLQLDTQGNALKRLLIFDGVSTEVIEPCPSDHHALSAVGSFDEEAATRFNALQRQLLLFTNC